MFKVRDLVPGDMSSAVRLLELCRNAADSKPVDHANGDGLNGPLFNDGRNALA